jgi:hypothetical protein
LQEAKNVKTFQRDAMKMNEKGLKIQCKNGSHFETNNKLVIQAIWFFFTFYLKKLNTLVNGVVSGVLLSHLIIIFSLFNQKNLIK